MNALSVSAIGALFFHAFCATPATADAGPPALDLSTAASGRDVLVATRSQYQSEDAVAGNIDDDASKWLAEVGMAEGWNTLEDGRRVLLQFGEADIYSSQGDPKFIVARNVAFSKAELQAKQQIAESIATQLKSKRSSEASQTGGETPAPIDPPPPEQLSIAEKALALTGAELDDAIRRYDPKWDGAGKTDAQRRDALVLIQQKYTNEASARARLYAGGSFVAAQFEGPIKNRGTLGVKVALVWSERLGNLAKALVLSAAKIKPGEPQQPLAVQFAEESKRNPSWLAAASGARVWTDEKGNPVVLGFGSVAASASSQIDRSRATLAARVAIQRFVAETVEVASDSRDDFTFQKFVDEQSKTSDSSKFTERIAARAADINLRGTAVVQDWFDKHPIGDVRMQTIVVAWTPDSAALARDLAAQMDKQENDMRSDGLAPQPDGEAPGGRKPGAAKKASAIGGAIAAPPIRGPASKPSSY